MKIVAIDLIDLFNYTFQRTLEPLIEIARNNRVNGVIEVAFLEHVVKDYLSALNKVGFSENTHFIIVDSSSISRNVGINDKECAQCAGLHWSLVIDAGLRAYLMEYNIYVPTSLETQRVWDDISKEIDRYKHITYADIGTDFDNTMIMLRDGCPVDIEKMTMDLYFGTPEITMTIVINPYVFYFNTYKVPLICELDEKSRNLLKTRADRVLRSIMN
jgi:hypothetical protein